MTALGTVCCEEAGDRAALQRLAATADAIPEVIVAVRIERTLAGGVRCMCVEHANAAAKELPGWDGPAVEGADLMALLQDHGELDLGRAVQTCLDTLSAVAGTVRLHPHGRPVDGEVYVAPVGADQLAITWRPHAPGRGASVASVAHVETIDPLTGLATRAEFLRRLGDRLSEPGRHNVAEAVCVLDLDGFGRLNDLAGPRRADQVLTTLARELVSVRFDGELPARIGADRFAFVVPGPVDDEVVDRISGLVRARLADVAAGLRLPRLTASAGLAVVDGASDLATVLHDCDVAVRASLGGGGDRLTVFEPALRASIRATSLQGEDILRGLAAGEFSLVYQPIIRLATSSQVGVEALARWHHPEVGPTSPDQFIPMAESAGVMNELGGWVIDRGIADLLRMRRRETVGINVSSLQLLGGDVPGQVAAALQRYGVDAARVFVEITESALLPEAVAVREQLTALRQLGVKIVIDDFGSGFSAIGYLDWIPADVVKLDRSFLAGDLVPRRRRLIAATVQLVRAVGASVLIEGIETVDQLSLARDCGVDLGQGFLLGRPAPLASRV